MIKSMTGFGRGKYQVEGIDVLIEIKTINHRYCDVFVKMPRTLSFLEDKIREVVGGQISRGKTEVFVTYQERISQTTEVFLDKSLAKSYYNALNEMKDGLELLDDISVSLIARFPDVIKVQMNELDETKLWEIIRIPLEEALKSLLSMRSFEGEKLAANLRDRLENIKKLVQKITSRAPEIPIEYAGKLKNRIEELLNGQIVDETRIAMEVALYADRCNIDEEIERLSSHISQFLALLKSKDAVGRKLDFLLQEMNREINTIGSKANDIEIVKDVVDLKSEIEKIREQIQNIE